MRDEQHREEDSNEKAQNRCSEDGALFVGDQSWHELILGSRNTTRSAGKRQIRTSREPLRWWRHHVLMSPRRFTAMVGAVLLLATLVACGNTQRAQSDSVPHFGSAAEIVVTSHMSHCAVNHFPKARSAEQCSQGEVVAFASASDLQAWMQGYSIGIARPFILGSNFIVWCASPGWCTKVHPAIGGTLY